MNSSCSVSSKFTNSRESARFSGRSAAAASRKEQPFPVVMITRIALDSVDEVTRKKKSFDS